MAEVKTKVNEGSVEAFIDAVADENKREDCYALVKLMSQVTGHEPKMWGTSIVGFDSYHYKYDSGHEGDAPLIGFSPRKANISLYLMCGFHAKPELMQKLGKHKMGKGCLYINRLADVDARVLKQVVEISIDAIKEQVAVRKGKK